MISRKARQMEEPVKIPALAMRATRGRGSEGKSTFRAEPDSTRAASAASDSEGNHAAEKIR